MKKVKYIATIFIAVAGLGLQQAQADLTYVTQFTLYLPIGNPSADAAYLIDNYGGSDTLTSLFKENNNGTTGGGTGAGLPLPASDFNIVMTTANTWTVSWDLTGSGFTLEFILLKDGVNGPHNQLYRLYAPTADQTVIGSGTVTFNSPVKNISFVEFLGQPTVPTVPDGGTTVMLLGAALSGLGLVRRFLKR